MCYLIFIKCNRCIVLLFFKKLILIYKVIINNNDIVIGYCFLISLLNKKIYVKIYYNLCYE